MKLTKGTIAFIIILLVVIIVYANYTYIYTPRMEKIKQLDKDIEEIAQKIAEGKRIAARLDTLKKEYAALKEKLGFLEVMLPKEKEIPDLLVMIQDTLTEFDVSFSNFTPQNISWEKGKIFGNMPINMNLNAKYFNLISYLDRIEHLPRIVDAKALKLNKNAKSTDELNITLNLHTYVLKKESVK